MAITTSGSTVHVPKPQIQRSHETREEKAAQAWANLHNRLLSSCIEASSHPIHGTLCCICSSSDSSVYCQDYTSFMEGDIFTSYNIIKYGST